MVLTSFYFFIFLAVLTLLYWTLPKRFQWILLLLGSIFFYLFAGLKSIASLVFITALTIWAGAYLIDKISSDRKKTLILIITILINIAILGFFKYYNFFADNINILAKLFHLNGQSLPILKLLLPLGISYYTFQTVGYLIDVYRGIAEPQKNPAKFALFAMFFPSVSIGPIHRYNELAPQLYAHHNFDYTQWTFGIQRILWGLFKKLVIADRLAMFVNPIFNDYGQYAGLYLFIAIIFFAFQIYTDFSGCMDIVIGAGQMFGIKMNENFNTPFFSRSISEFWRRWHITLGAWMKDY
ncbi:MAG: hypothetical protein LBN20_05450, partial [Endomicrobium sp.]|nr:hypothetical protein [Endomicrobium sp.]